MKLKLIQQQLSDETLPDIIEEIKDVLVGCGYLAEDARQEDWLNVQRLNKPEDTPPMYSFSIQLPPPEGHIDSQATDVLSRYPDDFAWLRELIYRLQGIWAIPTALEFEDAPKKQKVTLGFNYSGATSYYATVGVKMPVLRSRYQEERLLGGIFRRKLNIEALAIKAKFEDAQKSDEFHRYSVKFAIDDPNTMPAVIANIRAMFSTLQKITLDKLSYKFAAGSTSSASSDESTDEDTYEDDDDCVRWITPAFSVEKVEQLPTAQTTAPAPGMFVPGKTVPRPVSANRAGLSLTLGSVARPQTLSLTGGAGASALGSLSLTGGQSRSPERTREACSFTFGDGQSVDFTLVDLGLRSKKLKLTGASKPSLSLRP